MTPILTIALRNLILRPWRSALLLGGFGIGVGVMIVLLAIGEAMLVQAREERLVGGGDITVLPEGIDVEVLKTGGVGGLFHSIPNARFLFLQLLDSPRNRADVQAVAPQIHGKLLYLTMPDGEQLAVRASGEIPSLSGSVGAMPEVALGTWSDDEYDRQWRNPTPKELRHAIDRFHLPPDDAPDRETWGEWHYFNVVSADGSRWAFITLAVGGDIPAGEWGGQVLVTTHGDGEPDRRFVATVDPELVRFSTHDANVRAGASSVTVLPDGTYRVVAEAQEEESGASVRVDLVVAPAAGAYFPGVELGGSDVVSGYVVPALRARGDGSICIDGTCESLSDVQAYHDHNWGIWRRVEWEWGTARAGDIGILYGRVNPPADVAEPPPLLFYLTDSLGFVALFRPREVSYEDSREVRVDGVSVRVPSRATLADARGSDTVRLDLRVEHATVTDTRSALLQRGDTAAARELVRPYFVQLKARAVVTGTVGGRKLEEEGVGFFEVYRSGNDATSVSGPP